MSQLLELLVAQQQQNVGLQSRVEELSQQVVSLKGNAAGSETAQAADTVQAATAATAAPVPQQQQLQVEGPGSKAAAGETASSAEQSPPLPKAPVADAPVAAQPQASTPLVAAQPPAAATATVAAAPHSQRPASATQGKALKPQNGQGKRDRQDKRDKKDEKDTKDRRDRQTQGRGRERGAVKVVPEDVRVLGRLEELRRQSDALVKALQARGAWGERAA